VGWYKFDAFSYTYQTRCQLKIFYHFNFITMSHIAIPIPDLPWKQEIQVEVTINGLKQQLHYRVELFYWQDCTNPVAHRADCISEMLSHQDPDWTVYYIGAPTDDFVPITFVKKESRNFLKGVAAIA
jgi:hypothetical protein